MTALIVIILYNYTNSQFHVINECH